MTPDPAEVHDLMKALKASLDAVKARDAADAPKTYVVTINGKVPTRAILHAHGARSLAAFIPGAVREGDGWDPAEFTDRAQADELAARCARWFPKDTVQVETR